MTKSPSNDLKVMRRLSPLRNSTQAASVDELVAEQLEHFGIGAATDYGRMLASLTRHLYQADADVHRLWELSIQSINNLDRHDRIAYFNAKKFLSFQAAKLLDTLQNPFRHSYQSLGLAYATQSAKGPYSIFDNVTAIFSATPVIARTATYIYACAEWIEDAFNGKELLLEIYSRLLNPTSVSLANFMVDIEAGPFAGEYFAWNFNSGMAAIDGVLSHVLGRDDVLVTSRNIYGGAHQLIHDWFAKPSNLGIAVETFEGYGTADFERCWADVQQKHADRFRAGRRAYLYLESPCNPHGYMLDVPSICRAAHEHDVRVMLDATVGTPFLVQPLQREDPLERPDFVIHSYTKDLSGTGSTIAGVVIGRNEDMFVPKGETAHGVPWNETMFWNVYYVKGAFLSADAAYEVMQGMRTLGVRMLAKCINTAILAKFFDSHSAVRVHCNALPADENAAVKERLSFLGLPPPLFTVDIDTVPAGVFQRFFDSLSPVFSHMISLGQSNTIISCPALTTHSELDTDSLQASGLSPTTIRFAIGDEDPKDLIAHFVEAARLIIDPHVPDFSAGFMDVSQVDTMVRETYVDSHERYIRSKRSLVEYLR